MRAADAAWRRRSQVLAEDGLGPDSVYVFDPLLITDRGAVPLRSGKPTRRGEEAALERWTAAAGIPTLGRIEPPGTVEGGDTFWLRPDLLCVGRSLRTNSAGAEQLARIVGGRVEVFDLPWWHGPAEVLHLLSVISPVADDLAVVFRPLLPAGLHELLGELGIRTLAVSEQRVRDARLQRARGPTGRGGRGRRQSRDLCRAGRGRLRGAYLRGERDRPQRQWRPNVPDAARPARHRGDSVGPLPTSNRRLCAVPSGTDSRSFRPNGTIADIGLLLTARQLRARNCSDARLPR